MPYSSTSDTLKRPMAKILPAYTFELASIRVEVEYRNVKTLRLTVYPPDGRVKIAAPPGTTRESIGTFAASKIKWIEKHRKKFLNNRTGTKQDLTGSLRNHSTVYVWGVPHELELVEREGNAKITVEGGRMTMRIRPHSPKAKKQEILDRWRRRSLKEAASPLIEKWEVRMGVEVEKLYVRKMKSHWGSCNCEKQTLRLNSELAGRSPEYLDYVIIHEMLHIIEKGHNRNFYRLLGKFIPEWKAIRKRLNAGEM